MPVTTYTKEGLVNIKSLICSLVIDLTGEGSPSSGSVGEHMRVVYPEGFDTSDPEALDDNTLVILESTTNIDPFARTDPTVEDSTKDPWRIAFHTSKWTGRSTTELPQGGQSWSTVAADPISINSLAVYVGTPSTLYVNPNSGDPVIGWNTTTKQKLPYYAGYPSIDYDGYLDSSGNPINGGAKPAVIWTYKKVYKGRDLVEPVGNTGAQWTNTFDPTINNTKLFAPPTTQTTPTPPPTAQYVSPMPWDGPDVQDANQLFINRYITAGAKTNAYRGFAIDSEYANPISYRLVLTDHGLFLGCWGPDPEEYGRGFSWVLVQRPVDKKFGIVRNLPEDPTNPGNRPLFCVNSVNGKIWKFVVREHDQAVPSGRKDATLSTPDSGAIINPFQQQSLTENGEYVITFLNNLNSSRFKYSDELDMIGTVSSDVVGGGSEIDVDVYNEEEKRTYHALWSSGPFGTRMRIMIVKDIPAPNEPT